MGTKGSKNTPITARISTGLFNQKKGVKEPLLDVGPAGVRGNNQTKDIPSPSKMKGYSMKASPFKQVNDKPVKATEVGINVLKTTTTPDTTKEVAGTPGTSNYDAAVAAEGTKIVDPKKITQAMTDKANKKRADAKALDVAAAKPKEVVVKGKTSSSNNYTSTQTRDKGDAQTSLDRRNTVRSGKHTARNKKAAQRKTDKNNRQTGAINPETGKKYNKRNQRLKRQGQQAKDNLVVATNENDNAKRQSKQNISPKGNKDVKGKTRNSELSDFTVDKQEAKIKAGGVNTPKRKRAKASGIKGVGVKNVGSTESKAPKISKTKPRTTRSTSGAEKLMVDPQNKDTKLAKRRTK
jgi:hypothetical protein